MDGDHRVAARAFAKVNLGLRVSVVPHAPEPYARALYAELHACDQTGADVIVVEAVPEGPEWRGIADRLRRAASPEVG